MNTAVNKTSTILKIERCYINKKSENTNSKFAPKKIEVYILPSIDDCIKLLPKEVGNHILSYTTAWMEYMLLHILEKYGFPFFKKLITDFIFKSLRPLITKYNGIQIINFISKNIRLFTKCEIDNVANNIKRGLDYRQQQIILKKENLITLRNERTERERPIKEYMKNIEIGSIVIYNNFPTKIGIVINKTPLSYKVVGTYNFQFRQNRNLYIRFLDLQDYEYTNGRLISWIDREIVPVNKILLKNGVELIIKKSKTANKNRENNIKHQIIDAELMPLDEDAYDINGQLIIN
jgi:hypothetical protein